MVNGHGVSIPAWKAWTYPVTELSPDPWTRTKDTVDIAESRFLYKQSSAYLILTQTEPAVLLCVRTYTTMSRSTKVYHEALSKLGYGFPLWRPEPSPDEVCIGDVGYIDPDSGSWHLLFNILDPQRYSQASGKPPDFQCLEGEVFKEKAKSLGAGVYMSDSIQKIGPESKDSQTFVYKPKDDKTSGALLALQKAGCIESLDYSHHHRAWVDHMRRYLNSWYEWATRRVYIQKEDILLISGFVKASAWSVVAFRSRNEELRLNLHDDGVPYKVEARSLLNQTAPIPEYRSATTFTTYSQASQPTASSSQPSSSPDATDCVFLVAYRAKYRIMRKARIDKLQASADPKDLFEDDSDDDENPVQVGDVEETIIVEPECSKSQSPIDRMLDTLIASASVDVATVSKTHIGSNFASAVRIDDLTGNGLGQHPSYAAACGNAAASKPSSDIASVPSTVLDMSSRGSVRNASNVKLCDRTAVQHIPIEIENPQRYFIPRSNIASKISCYIEKLINPTVVVI
ncbi:hypothetical protein QCA50_013661 [Cerrena zonata]|uniref:Uncharacterized protein n=1 Tax=Cerrena zonata TaxID=2478898 RepID=A0AAW0FV97_9APHY